MMTLQIQVGVMTRLVVSEQLRTDGKNHIANGALLLFFFLFVLAEVSDESEKKKKTVTQVNL